VGSAVHPASQGSRADLRIVAKTVRTRFLTGAGSLLGKHLRPPKRFFPRFGRASRKRSRAGSPIEAPGASSPGLRDFHAPKFRARSPHDQRGFQSAQGKNRRISPLQLG
jgi:hypothetical protein